MADLTQLPTEIFVEKFKEICLSQPSIFSKIAYEMINGTKHRQIYHGEGIPNGKKFPCVQYMYTSGPSEEILPSESGTLSIYVYIEKDTIEAYQECFRLLNAIDDKINNHPDIFTEINQSLNKGLLCKKCTRASRQDLNFHDTYKLFFMSSVYDIRISNKLEDYKDVNNQSWNPNI